MAPVVLSSTDATTSGEFGYSVAADSSIVAVGAPNEAVGGYGAAGHAYLYNSAGALTHVLTSPTPQAAGWFGWSVAVSGNLVVVGAPGEAEFGTALAGNVYVFNSSGALLASYTSPYGRNGGAFGRSVAIDGNTIIIGAPNENGANIAFSGDAYIVDYPAKTLRLVFSPVPQSSGAFGYAVSVNGNLAIVGAPGEQSGGVSGAGTAYLVSTVTNDVIKAIPAPQPSPLGSFGSSVAISYPYVVVGAPGEPSIPLENGSAYLFNLITHSVAVLGSPTPSTNGFFGSAVAVDPTTILVGAPGESSGGEFSAGNAYMFSTLTGTLITSDFAAPGWPYDGYFGSTVAEVGSTAVIGANMANSSGQYHAGLAFLFDNIPLTFTSPNAIGSGLSGYSVSMNGAGSMVVGAPDEGAGASSASGHVYVIPVDPSPSLSVLTLSSPNAITSGHFGQAVASSGNLLVVGAPGETAGGDSAAGRAYVYNLATGSLLFNLFSPNNATSGLFGVAVATDGVSIVVASQEAYSGDTAAGRAYVYSATTGLIESTLSTPNPASNGLFGNSVSVSGATVLVGAPQETAGGQFQGGNAYLFTASTGVLQRTLTSPSPQNSGWFGWSVSLAAGTAVVGAPGEPVTGLSFAGRVYTFTASTGALGLTLFSPNAIANGDFGAAVSTNGVTIAIGAPDEPAVGSNFAGNVYLVDLHSGVVFDRLNSPAAQVDGVFGFSLSEGPGRLLVGAPYEEVGQFSQVGHAYLFCFGSFSQVGA
ncbi:MAG TPA: hypothetical protein VEH57_08180 [Thermoplasmata archaeon]|nr:hypothetical protein [Thermoplasmata archaeon]